MSITCLLPALKFASSSDNGILCFQRGKVSIFPRGLRWSVEGSHSAVCFSSVVRIGTVGSAPRSCRGGDSIEASIRTDQLLFFSTCGRDSARGRILTTATSASAIELSSSLKAMESKLCARMLANASNKASNDSRVCYASIGAGTVAAAAGASPVSMCCVSACVSAATARGAASVSSSSMAVTPSVCIPSG